MYQIPLRYDEYFLNYTQTRYEINGRFFLVAETPDTVLDWVGRGLCGIRYVYKRYRCVTKLKRNRNGIETEWERVWWSKCINGKTRTNFVIFTTLQDILINAVNAGLKAMKTPSYFPSVIGALVSVPFY